MEKAIEMNTNVLVAFFQKPVSNLTKTDIVTFVRERCIRMVDFMYPAEDGKIKTLNFMINNLAYFETILTDGERVDGSSLFPSFVEAENSDLYVVPRFETAFINFLKFQHCVFYVHFLIKTGNRLLVLQWRLYIVRLRHLQR